MNFPTLQTQKQQMSQVSDTDFEQVANVTTQNKEKPTFPINNYLESSISTTI
jgi:hypothetical protein